MRAEYEVLAGAARAKSLGIAEPPPKPPVPQYKQPVTSFHIARDGRLWVRISQPGVREPLDTSAAPPPVTVLFEGSAPVKVPPRPAFAWPEPDVYEVFEGDGRYVGRAKLPRGASLRAAYGERVWAVVTDANDLPYVVRYRVEPPFGK
jgi:hypothetical protein